MRKQLISLLLFGLFINFFTLFAQNEHYPKKKVKGVEYYVYSVQPHEGLYAISRRFGVSQADINDANPQIEDGLKIGQVLLIPVTGEKVELLKKPIEQQNTQEFITHKVEKKQTIFAICRKYKVSQEEIKKYNPAIVNGLQEGMILRIPVGKVEKPTEKIDSNEMKTRTKNSRIKKESFIIHVVRKGETLYSISNKYKVSQSEIINLNPRAAKHVGVGDQLNIPTKSKQLLTDKYNRLDSNVNADALMKIAQIQSFPTEKHRIQIAILLPFMLNQSTIDPGTNRFLDFYGGALLALNEAKAKGISADIYVFDTEKSDDKMMEILNNPDLKKMDLIIGPAFSNQVALIGDFAKKNKIHTLIPFSSKDPDIDFNPYLYQFNPGSDAAVRFSTELLLGKYKKYHPVFVELPDVDLFDDGKTWSDNLQNQLSEKNKKFSILNVTSPESIDFSSVLKPDEKNLIIFNTDKYGYAAPYIQQLKSLEKQYPVVLFEQYSWVNQSGKLADNIYISPFSPMLNPEELSSFNQKFISAFHRSASTDLPRFDLLGYDLTNHFITLIHRYGIEFTEKMGTNNSSKWIQSQPLFERISAGAGFVNQKLYVGDDKTE
jgi:LysM repeat protein